MILDQSLLTAARYAVGDLIALRRLGGRPIPDAVLRLNDALQQAMSADGPETDCPAGESAQDDLIGPKEAARLLGCSVRHVRRIATDLDGFLCEGWWVFRRQAVAEYAEAKGVGYGSD